MSEARLAPHREQIRPWLHREDEVVFLPVSETHMLGDVARILALTTQQRLCRLSPAALPGRRDPHQR